MTQPEVILNENTSPEVRHELECFLSQTRDFTPEQAEQITEQALTGKINGSQVSEAAQILLRLAEVPDVARWVEFDDETEDALLSDDHHMNIVKAMQTSSEFNRESRRKAVFLSRMGGFLVRRASE